MTTWKTKEESKFITINLKEEEIDNGTVIVSLIAKLHIHITIEKINIGFAILFNPIPQARRTVISDAKLNLFNVITVDNKTPIGIVITKTSGK